MVVINMLSIQSLIKLQFWNVGTYSSSLCITLCLRVYVYFYVFIDCCITHHSRTFPSIHTRMCIIFICFTHTYQNIYCMNTQGLIGKCIWVEIVIFTILVGSCFAHFALPMQTSKKNVVHLADESQWKFYYWSSIFSSSLFLIVRSRHRLIAEMKENLLHACLKP